MSDPLRHFQLAIETQRAIDRATKLVQTTPDLSSLGVAQSLERFFVIDRLGETIRRTIEQTVQHANGLAWTGLNQVQDGLNSQLRDAFGSLESITSKQTESIRRALEPFTFGKALQDQLAQINSSSFGALFEEGQRQARSLLELQGGIERTLKQLSIPDSASLARDVRHEIELRAAAAQDSTATERPNALQEAFSAVGAVVRRHPITFADSLAILGLLVAVLFGVYQITDGARQEREYKALFQQTLQAIAALKQDVNSVRALPGLRVVERRTYLYRKPRKKSGGIAPLDSGRAVLIAKWRGPWVYVVAPGSAEDGADAQTGWMMKKYLRRMR